MRSKRTVGLALAGTAAAASLLGGVGTANATTVHHPIPGRAVALGTNVGCSSVWIGTHSPYYWAGQLAGYVQQYWDQCDDRVSASWHWDATFQANNPNAQVQVLVGSPYHSPITGQPVEDQSDVYYANGMGQDLYWESSQNHGATNPDAWRAGAIVWNQVDPGNTCYEWSTLHWYGGQDWDGDRGGCDDPMPPLPDGSQPQ